MKLFLTPVIPFSFAVFFGLLSLISKPANAAWKLENKASSLSFVSIKKTHIAEVHQFKKLTGTLTDQGEATIEIALDSVDTLIPIRNERMKKMLFNTANFPKAVLTTNVNLQKVNALKSGDTYPMDLIATLKIGDKENQFKLPVIVAKMEKGRLFVSSQMPVIIRAKDFGLERGVEALRNVAGLDSISYAVPVSFNVRFDP